MQQILTLELYRSAPDRFADTLKANAVDAIIDIREWNEGPSYRFASGGFLRSLARGVGTAYRHAPWFGIMLEELHRAGFKDWAKDARTGRPESPTAMDAAWLNVAGEYARPCLLGRGGSRDHQLYRQLGERLASELGITAVHLS